MSNLEPNLVALSWFVLLWSVCCLGFLQLAGMYPLRAEGEGKARNSILLVLGHTALWLALLAGTLFFASLQLRWTTIVVVAGLLFLFIPGLFQAIPTRFRDGRVGMAIGGCMITLTLGLLVWLSSGEISGAHS
jgi:hypothetical protein